MAEDETVQLSGELGELGSGQGEQAVVTFKAGGQTSAWGCAYSLADLWVGGAARGCQRH